jgi:hypothetical protein
MKKRYIVLIAVIVILVGLRLYLPVWLKNNINDGLKKGQRSTGSISEVDLNLFKGTMTLRDLEIFRDDRPELIPHFTCNRISVHIRWRDLIQGRFEGKAYVYQPVLLFFARLQYGRGKDWTKPIKEMMPIRINQLTIDQGEIHYRDEQSDPELDVFLKDIHLEATDLSNSRDPESEMPSEISATATSVGNGKLELEGKANILMKLPDMDLNLSLENVDITALNDYLKKNASLDAEKGTFNLYAELLTDSGKADGYLKPVIQDLKLVNSGQEDDKVLQVAWESIAGFMIEVFENQKKDQFATKIPFKKDLGKIKANFGQAFWNLLSNAFVDAFKKQTEGTIGSGGEGTSHKIEPDEPDNFYVKSGQHEKLIPGAVE